MSLLRAVDESTASTPVTPSLDSISVSTGTQVFMPYRTLATQTDTLPNTPISPTRIGQPSQIQIIHSSVSTQTLPTDTETLSTNCDNCVSQLEAEQIKNDLRQIKAKMNEITDLKKAVDEMLSIYKNITDVLPQQPSNHSRNRSPSQPRSLPGPFSPIHQVEAIDDLSPPRPHAPMPIPVIESTPRPAPRPLRDIPNVLDPLERAVRDPYLADLAPEKACTTLACRLADIVFGPEVLANSNLTGRDDRQALHPDQLTKIQNLVRRQFGNKFATEKEFLAVWRKCRECIGTKCKNARRSLKITIRR